MSTSPLVARPPIGFIVEGRGEYYAYPSLVARLLGLDGVRTPIVNASGYGSLVNRIDEHLSDLVAAYHPRSIVITIDLLDVLRDKLFEDCRSLRADLTAKSQTWMERNQAVPKLQPFPQNLSVVIQIQKFETWLIADYETVVEHGIIALRDDEPHYEDVDSQVTNPTAWIRKRLEREFNSKNPSHCKELVSRLDLQRMRSRSRSFDKFSRDIEGYYAEWMELIKEN